MLLLIYAGLTGLVFWIVAWAVGVKSLDAFLVTILIFILAAAYRTLAPRLPADRPESETPRPPS